MRYKITMLALLLLIVETAFAQEKVEADTLHCNTKILSKVASRLDSLEQKTLTLFFLTFDSTCKNNIEFSEWSNELLFKVLEKYPETSLRILTLDKNIKFSYILHEVQNPLFDVDVKKIYLQIRAVKSYKSTQTKMLTALKVAAKLLEVELNANKPK